MAKYILVKKVKGKKYEYQVIDVDSKAIVSKRTSAREYVACTAELLEHEYVVFGEYDLRTLERITRETGYYGDIYRNVYIERVKDNPRRNEVTPGVGTQ